MTIYWKPVHSHWLRSFNISLTFGTLDITVVNDIEAEMSLPLNSAGSITTDLASMIRSKNSLPPECRTVWNDFHLIEVFSKRLNPAERAKVDTVLDIKQAPAYVDPVQDHL